MLESNSPKSIISNSTASTGTSTQPPSLLHSLLKDWKEIKGSKERQITIDLIERLIDWLKDPQNASTPNVPHSLQAEVTKQKIIWKDALSSWNKISKHLQKIPTLHDIHPQPKSQITSTNQINLAIIDHFKRRGDFQTAETIAKNDTENEMENYVKLHSLLTSLNKYRDTKPSLQWLEDNRLLLGEERISLLRLCLHRLEFISLLRNNSKGIIEYAKKNLLPLLKGFRKEVESLMGAIAFCPSFTSKQNPYISLLERDLWGEVESLLIATFLPLSSLYGQTLTSSLEEVIGAGQIALPPLSKVMLLMKGKPGVNWCPQDELPIMVGMDHTTPGAGAFHSIFVCPVLRQQSTPTNPPMLMACGHVISKEALTKLGRGHQHQRIKCPYCPMEGTIGQAREIFFE